MELFAGLSVAVLVLAASVVAIKTFLLWRRTRGLPELLLGLYLTCATAVGYPLAIAMAQIPASDNPAIHVIAELVMSTGWVALYLFTWNVFRPNADWAKLLVGSMLLFIACSAVAYILEATGPNPRSPGDIPTFTVSLSIPVGLAYFWTLCEAFSYSSRLRRRIAIGLADPAVANRVFLWGVMTSAALLALVVNMIGLMMGVYMSPAIVVFSSFCGLAHAVCLFLAFHPPAWYRDWVQGGASAAEGA